MKRRDWLGVPWPTVRLYFGTVGLALALNLGVGVYGDFWHTLAQTFTIYSVGIVAGTAYFYLRWGRMCFRIHRIEKTLDKYKPLIDAQIAKEKAAGVFEPERVEL